ncbi:MAG TPA: BatA and WFA domain-containing protein [Fimbriimonadaceae bacterium]|nr:BatA and WFA domain-containing protein [Fimbriimonadaceae bacterium]
MSFQNPGALLWLLPLAGVIVILYLLRMRRRDVKVPASFLWPERTDEVRANALIQRLRFSWLLVLQLLALMLVVFAVARPQTKQEGLAGKVTVLVVDASASMGATDVKPSRFDVAKGMVVDAIKAAHVGDRIALIEAGPAPRVVFPLANDPAKELHAIDNLRRYDAECDVGEALRLASALVGAQDGARIVLLSDGCFDPIKNFAPGKAALVYQLVGSGSRNLAVSALGTAETPRGRQLFVGVKSYALKDMDATVNLYGDGKLIDSEKITVKTGLQWGKTLPVSNAVKVFEAKLEAPEDQLPADDYAVALADPGASLRVLLVSASGDPFTERALVLDPRVTLDRATTLPVDTSPYDIVVFDGVEERPVRSRGVLTFGSAGAPSPVTVIGRDNSPRFISSEKKPLMENVDLDGVYIQEARRVKPKAAAEVLALSSSGPLVVSSRSGGLRQIYVSFEPLQSDFPLQVSFPIFIANALDDLGGQESANRLAVRAGAPFSLTTPSAVTLRAPDGESTIIPSTAGSVVVRNARQIGRYDLEVGGKTKPVYAYLRSDRESEIAPVQDIQLGGGGKTKAQRAPVRFADFWRPLGLLALLVLGGEWWLYARRS